MIFSSRSSIGDLTGRRFMRLKVVEFAGRDVHGFLLWNCICDCGNSFVTTGNALHKNRAPSCGCLKKERMKKQFLVHGHARKGDMSRTFRSWCNMHARCSYRKNKTYLINYINRGIVVCERWNSFENFLADMGERPSLKHSIDRYPNNDGNYEPSNCRWATQKEQCQNSRPWNVNLQQGETI